MTGMTTMMTMEDMTNVLLTALAPAAVILLIALIMQIITGILCYKLARRKGYRGYFFTGLFLGVIGLIYVVGLPDLNAKKDVRLVMKRMVNLHERLSVLEEDGAQA